MEAMDKPYTYTEGYTYGLTREDPRGQTVGSYNLHEAKEAVANWRAAASDHGHTSFWGIEHIRAMRAYWLGYARGRIEWLQNR
jgi:hypothetical protein